MFQSEIPDDLSIGKIHESSFKHYFNCGNQKHEALELLQTAIEITYEPVYRIEVWTFMLSVIYEIAVAT